MDKRGLPLVNHLLQYTLRTVCAETEWVYAVFWRILPRKYPPPKWDTEGGFMDRSKGNKRNWILVWEDGFCDFQACSRAEKEPCSGNGTEKECGASLQPELFFKMSHEIYNYGEGLMGKVAVDNSHKWIFRDPPDHEISFLSPWQGSLDPHPRTWEAQFKAGIQTIAVVAVGEGLLQLGSTKKMMEDLNLVILLRRKFNYLQSIPGIFAPHPITELDISSICRSRDDNVLDEKLPCENGLWNTADAAFVHAVPTTNGRKPPFSAELGTQHSQLLGTKRPLEQSDFSIPLIYKIPSPFLVPQGGLLACDRSNVRSLLTPEIFPSFKTVSQDGHSHTPQNVTEPLSELIPSMSCLHALLSKLPSVTTSNSNFPFSSRSSISQCNLSSSTVPHGQHLCELSLIPSRSIALADAPLISLSALLPSTSAAPHAIPIFGFHPSVRMTTDIDNCSLIDHTASHSTLTKTVSESKAEDHHCAATAHKPTPDQDGSTLGHEEASCECKDKQQQELAGRILKTFDHILEFTQITSELARDAIPATPRS
eukprot:c34192_g1_i1 orf=804-2417(+)